MSKRLFVKLMHGNKDQHALINLLGLVALLIQIGICYFKISNPGDYCSYQNMKIALIFILTIACLSMTRVHSTQYICDLAHGCQSCWNGSICSSCATGYNNRQLVCNTCTDTHCMFCASSNSTCTECTNYYGVSGTSCARCTFSSCMNCTYDINYCYYCNVVKMGPNNGICVACIDPYCNLCRTDYTVCQSCDAQYGKLNGVGDCTACTLAFCGICNANHSICTRCITSYGFTTGSNSSCIPCLDANCLLCYPSAYSCDQCNTLYGLDNSPNRTCQPCNSNVPHCLQCGLYMDNCTRCQNGYAFDSSLMTATNNGTCFACNVLCATCIWNDSSLCTGCYPDRFLVTANLTCQTCMVGCQSCTNLTVCITCLSDFYKVNITCVPCPDYCLDCHLNATYNLPECTSCNTSSLGLNHFLPPVCKEQACGDSVTTTLDCDNAVGVPYDGCDDNCQIDPDFICNVTSGTTVCSYTQPIQLLFLGLQRSGSGVSNIFKLTIGVLPPLNVFSLSSQSEIAALFSLSVPNFTVSGVVYNAQDGTLEYDLELVDDLSDGHFTLAFDTGSSSRLEFLNTPNVTAALQLDFGGLDRLSVVSKEQKILGPLLQDLSWGILALGWLGCVLGLFMRRLSGLEAMFVVQLGWLCIFLLKSQLTYPFTQVWPLRFSAGPNYPIGGADTKEAVRSPYFAQFKFSSSLFYINFNFCALLQLCSLFAVIVCYLRIRAFRAQHKLTGRELYLKEPLNEEASKLNNRYEFAEQCLIYFSLLNAIYFVNRAVLFFQYGRRTDLVSIVAVALESALLLAVLVRFWLYPDPCDYFRYSFRKTALALSHYYIKSAFLLLIAVLLSPLVDSSAAALVPCFVLLVYTAVYRPYQDACENIRAVFNLLTMCAFCGLRVYSQYVPSSSFNRLPTYLFLAACLGLLLVVVLFGLVATVYFYYHYNYRLPMLARELDESDEVACKKEILRELTAIHPSKQMRVIEDGANYKRVITADKSLRVFSNNLQDRALPDLKDYREVGLLSQSKGSDSPKSLLDSSRKMLKEEMLGNSRAADRQDDGIVRGFDTAVAKKEVKANVKSNLNVKTQQANEEAKKEEAEPKKLLDQIATEVAKDENGFINLSAAVTYFNEQLKTPLDNKTDIYEEAYNNIPPS